MGAIVTDIRAFVGRSAVAVLLSGALMAALPIIAGCAGGDTTATTPVQQHAETTTTPGFESEVAAGSELGAQSVTPSSQAGSVVTEDPTAAGGRSPWGEIVLCEGLEQGISVQVILHRPKSVPDAEMGMSDPEMNRLVALPVALQNAGKEAVALVLDWFELDGSDGVVYRPAPLTDSPVALLQPGDISPGEGIEGYVVFEVPEGVDIRSGACDLSLGADPGSRRVWAE